MNHLFNFALHTISSAISIYLLYYFFNTFFEKAHKKSITYLILFIAEALFVVSLTLIFDYLTIRLLATTSVIVLVSFVFKMKWYYHIIMPMTLYAILSISEYSTISLVSILFSLDIQTATSGKYFVIGLFLSKFISFVIISTIRIAKYKFTNQKFHKNLFATIFIPFSTMTVILLQYRFFIQTDELSTFMSFLALFCYSALIISNIFCAESS